MKKHVDYPSLNSRGNAMIVAMGLVGVIGFVSVTMTSLASHRVKQQKQTNLRPVADRIRQEVTNLVSSPWIWQRVEEGMIPPIKNYSMGSLESFPISQRQFDLFSVDDNGQLQYYYRPSVSTAGFTPRGSVCDGLSNGDGYFIDDKDNGNPKCPFRYELTLVNRIMRDGAYIDTIRFKLKFRPGRGSGWTFNDEDPTFNFDLTRNFQGKSVETMCFLLDGKYSKTAASCTRKLTQDTNCATGSAFTGGNLETTTSPGESVNGGPYPTTSPTNAQTGCSSMALTKTCPTGEVITNFDEQGNPVCSALQ